MPENKNQHYVPQFYLKNFSENRKQIGLYNIPSNWFVTNANIKDESSEDYFFGKDSDYDKALKLTEDTVAPIFENIIKFRKLPARLSKEHNILLAFVLLLKNRTKSAQQDIIEGFTKFREQVISGGVTERVDELLSVPTKKEAIELSIQATLQLLPFGIDLVYKLLLNNSSLDFITSDNPVIYYNQFLETRNPVFSNTGLVSKGLEIFIPISPKHCLVFFDERVYGLGSKNEIMIKVDNATDIEQINQLQYISANRNIYFNQTFNKDYLVKIFISKVETYRRSSKICIEEKPVINKPNSTIVQVSRVEVRNKLNLSFIKILRRAQKFKINNRSFIPRTEKLGELV